jgi:hypothetical protein
VTISRLLAQMTVSSSVRSIAWYSLLFGRGPDARPMDGLVEWHLSEAFGVQVWVEPARAGTSCMVLDDDDLDARLRFLDDAGIENGGIRPASAFRILPVVDPDGNRITFAESSATAKESSATEK